MVRPILRLGEDGSSGLLLSVECSESAGHTLEHFRFSNATGSIHQHMRKASRFQDGLCELSIHLIEQRVIDGIGFEGVKTCLVFWVKPAQLLLFTVRLLHHLPILLEDRKR